MPNIASLLNLQLARNAEKAIYRQAVDCHWRDLNATDIAGRAGRWQEAFRRDGLARGERVALCLRNGVDWVAADLAALGAGLVVVPLYVDDNAGNIAYCVANSGARLLIVENMRIANALMKTEIPLPRILVLREPEQPIESDRIQTAESFLPPSGERATFAVEELPPNALATICYTSGTVGRPKGVMLSHQGILANVDSCEALDIAREEDEFLSFLPLSHMFERTGGYYLPLKCGAKVTYARSVSHLVDDLATQSPTIVFAVPRIFEKFHARLFQTLSSSPRKKKLLDACIDIGWRVASGHGSVWDHFRLPILRGLVARPILSRLGGRMRLAVVGGAALEPRIARTFIALGLPILHGYGMTEAAPVISVNRVGDNVPESVGPPLPGVEVRLGELDELLVRGANVMLGYWQDEPASRRTLDADGWLHTGDVAEIIDRRIFIRGRIKDILVLSNGEKCPPQDIELAILGDDAFEQIMLIGEGRPFLSLIAVTELDDEKELVRRANERLKNFPRTMRIRRVIRTKEPWTVDNGLLTPTMKVRRKHVTDHLAGQIDGIYAGAGEE